MDRQQIVISGLGGQGVLFITRLLAETALNMGMAVISSETHGMAMRGGAVISYLKVGPYPSPLIRAGQADLAVFLAEENLNVHGQIIGPRTRVLVNSASGRHEGMDAGTAAQEAVGRRQAANLVLLGYGLGRGLFFAGPEDVRATLRAMKQPPAVLEANEKALDAGLARAGA